MTAPVPRPPPGLCLMPWIHAHVTAQGFRKLCCIDKAWKRETAEDDAESFEAFWNSAEMREVRRTMLAGELPERCGNCFASPTRPISYRDEILARWPEAVDEVLVHTAADGSTDLLPFTFDYRSANCNLRCRTCGPHSSTSAETEARGSSEIGRLEGIDAWDEGYRARRDRSLVAARDDLIAAARAGRIRHLYWAGGEPLMDETHWQVMGELVDRDMARQVDVAYNTNLTVFAYRGRRVADLWPRFRSVHVQASVDGVGEAGEYVRTGFRTPIFADHLDEILDLAARQPQIRVVLDLTLTSVGLLHLGGFIDFALDHDVTVLAKRMIPRRINAYLAVEFLPQAVRDDWCRRWIAAIDARDRRGRLGALRTTLEMAMDGPTAEPDAADRGYYRRVVAAFEASRHTEGGLRRLLAADARLDGLFG